MNFRISAHLAALAAALVTAACAGGAPRPAGAPAGVAPERAGQAASRERLVRRDLPMTTAFESAYAAGTRDSTGAPGRRYWQQKVDYRIEATVDPATNQVRGREVISLHNTTPDTLKTIVLRLYQNYFSARVKRSAYITDITDGVTVERLSVNGAAIALADSRQYSVNETIATVTPAAPIPPGATAAHIPARRAMDLVAGRRGSAAPRP
jgi:hypothetical protein